MNNDLKIYWFSPHSLKPYEDNPRINDNSVNQCAASISEFGFANPISVDKDMVIICGHTRLKAALKLGLETVPVTILNNLTPEQVRAYRLADNKVSELSEWNEELLLLELEKIDSLDMSLFGFEIIGDEQKKDPNKIPVKSRKAKTKTGDQWTLGRHRLLCGDSTKASDAKKLMKGKKAELLFTSPPYSDMRDYNGEKELEVNHLVDFISIFCEYSFYQVINLGLQRKNNEINQYWDEYIKKAKESGYKFLSWNIWSRRGFGGSLANMTAMFRMEHEFIFVFGRDRKEINKTQKNKHSGILSSQTARQKDGSTKYTKRVKIGEYGKLSSVIELDFDKHQDHPAVFPVEFPEEYIKAMTDEKDIVLEPFAGSGTTAIACERTGRTCYMMEIDPIYCDMIVKRWQDFTGKKAINQRTKTALIPLAEKESENEKE